MCASSGSQAGLDKRRERERERVREGQEEADDRERRGGSGIWAAFALSAACARERYFHRA